jgi:hypothetical protein
MDSGLLTISPHSYPGAAAGRTRLLIHPSRISLPRKGCRHGGIESVDLIEMKAQQEAMVLRDPAAKSLPGGATGSRRGEAIQPELQSGSTLDLLTARRDGGVTLLLAGQVNSELPFISKDAEVVADEFDFILDGPDTKFSLFAPPREIGRPRTTRGLSRRLNLQVLANCFFDKITGGNQTTPGKPYPNTTEAGFMKVNDTPAASGSLSDILPFRRPTGQ